MLEQVMRNIELSGSIAVYHYQKCVGALAAAQFARTAPTYGDVGPLLDQRAPTRGHWAGAGAGAACWRISAVQQRPADGEVGELVELEQQVHNLAGLYCATVEMSGGHGIGQCATCARACNLGRADG